MRMGGTVKDSRGMNGRSARIRPLVMIGCWLKLSGRVWKHERSYELCFSQRDGRDDWDIQAYPRGERRPQQPSGGVHACVA
jgi:hypothetical protein